MATLLAGSGFCMDDDDDDCDDDDGDDDDCDDEAFRVYPEIGGSLSGERSCDPDGDDDDEDGEEGSDLLRLQSFNFPTTACCDYNEC